MSVVMALDKIAKGTMKGATDLLSTLVGYFRPKLRDPLHKIHQSFCLWVKFVCSPSCGLLQVRNLFLQARNEELQVGNKYFQVTSRKFRFASLKLKSVSYKKSLPTAS